MAIAETTVPGVRLPRNASKEEPVKTAILAIVISAILQLGTAAVASATKLTSAPLKGGAGGFVCACVNLSGKNVELLFRIKHDNGATGCTVLADSTGFPANCTRNVANSSTCEISRTDGKSLSSKQFACTLTSIDASGHPLAVVPVDLRLKQ